MAPLKHIRILVVEDNRQLLRLVAMWLETLPGVSEVTCVTSTHEALNHLAHDVPNLILTNWHLEHANGANVIDRLRSRSDMTNIVVMMRPGAVKNTDVKVGKGADLYLEKSSLFAELPLFLARQYGGGPASTLKSASAHE